MDEPIKNRPTKPQLARSRGKRQMPKAAPARTGVLPPAITVPAEAR